MLADQCLMAPCAASPTPPPVQRPSSQPMSRHQSHWCTPTKETGRMVVDYDKRTGKKMINQYLLLRTLGQGCHGRVKLAVDVTTGQHYAIKIIDKWQNDRRLSLRAYNSGGNDGGNDFRARTPDSLQPSSLAKRRSYRVSSGQLEKIRKEIAILKKCRHPNIVHLYEVIDDPAAKKIYLILEYMEGGELQWRDGDDRPVLALGQIRTIFRDLVLGVEYLHYQGVIHRDIKPANLLLGAKGAIKISDFGVSHFSQHVMHRQALTHRTSLASSDGAKQQSPLRSITSLASNHKGTTLGLPQSREPSPADRTALERYTPVSTLAEQPLANHTHQAPGVSCAPTFGSMLGSARGLNLAAGDINQPRSLLPPPASPQRPRFASSLGPSSPSRFAQNTPTIALPGDTEAGVASADPVLTSQPIPLSTVSPHTADSMASETSAVTPARRTPVLFFGSSDDESDAELNGCPAPFLKPAHQSPFTALGVYDCEVDYDPIDDSDSDDFWSDFDFDEAEAVVEDYNFSVPNSPLPLPPSLSTAEQIDAPHLTTSEFSSDASQSLPPHSPRSPTSIAFACRSRRGSTVQWATTKVPGTITEAEKGTSGSSGSTQPILLAGSQPVAQTSTNDLGGSLLRPSSRYSLADATLFLPGNSLLDSDKELAKTAGSPAFFAPELCCTTPELNHLLAQWRKARGVLPQPERQLPASSAVNLERKPGRLRSRSLNPISSLLPKSPVALPKPLPDPQGSLGRSQSTNWLTARVRRPSLSTLLRTATMRRSQSQQPTPSGQLATGSDTLALQLNASVSASESTTPCSSGGVRLISPLAHRQTTNPGQPSPTAVSPAAAVQRPSPLSSYRTSSRPSVGSISVGSNHGAPTQFHVEGMAGKFDNRGSAHPSPVRPASAVILDHATPWRPQPLGRSATSHGRIRTQSSEVCSNDAGDSSRSATPWSLSSMATKQRRASLQVTSLLRLAPDALASPVLAQPTEVQLDHPASPTPSYHGITKAIDLWAMGVTLYCLVYGRCPFIADTEYELFQIIPHQELEFPDEVRGAGAQVPDGLKDLIRGLMDKDYTHRLTIDQVKRHPWVVEGLEDGHRWAERTDPHGQYPEVEVSSHDISNALVPLYQWPKRLGQGIRRMSLSVVNSLKGWRGKKKSSPEL